MTIGERIKKMRKELNLTQQGFAERMNLKQNTITRIETGSTSPSPAVISLICRTFRVREEWLREGIEPMFRKPSGNAEQVREWLDGIFEKGSKFEQSFVTAMSHFTDKEWGILERFLIDLKAEQEAEDAAEKARRTSAGFTAEEMAVYEKVKAAIEQEAFDAETAALHAELNRQREAEKRAASASSAESSDTASLIGRRGTA